MQQQKQQKTGLALVAVLFEALGSRLNAVFICFAVVYGVIVGAVGWLLCDGVCLGCRVDYRVASRIPEFRR